MAEPDPIRALIEYMAKSLADEPEAVTVVLVSGEGGSIYRLVAAPNDVDRIIGKHNHTVRSMRIIFRNRCKTEQEGVIGGRRIRDRFQKCELR